MDTLVNTLLGRPTSFSPSLSLTDMNAESDQQDVASILDASFELSTMIEAFVAQTTKDINSGISTAEFMLQRIRRCMNTFPTGYRSIKVSDLASLQPDELAGMLGNVHLACIYYHAVMLICRPYFMASLVTRMKADHSRNTSAKVPTESDRMAEACIDAAIFEISMNNNQIHLIKPTF